VRKSRKQNHFAGERSLKKYAKQKDVNQTGSEKGGRPKCKNPKVEPEPKNYGRGESSEKEIRASEGRGA